MNALAAPSVAAIAAQLLARSGRAERQTLSPEMLDELGAWSASETQREEFCRQLNEARLNAGFSQPLLLELVRDEHLASAVSSHATNRGEIIVKEIARGLFAIMPVVAS